MQAGFFPASKRGLQVQNLQRALAALRTGQGYLAGLPARRVDALSDGFREATLDFLWNLLLQHQVEQPLMLADCARLHAPAYKRAMRCECWHAAWLAYRQLLTAIFILIHLVVQTAAATSKRLNSIAGKFDICGFGVCSCRCFWTCEPCMPRWTASPKQAMVTCLGYGCPACPEPKQVPRPQASSWRCC